MNFKELQERLEQGDKMAPQELRDKVCQSSEEEVRDWVRGTLPLWETSSEVWDFDDAPEEGLFASKIGNLVWNALMEESKKPLIAYALGLMCWEGGERYADENGNVEARYIRWYEESYNHFKDAKGIAHARHLMGLQWQDELGRSYNAQGMARYYGEAAVLGYKDAFDELLLMYVDHCCDEDVTDYALYDEIKDAMEDVLHSGREEVVSWFRAEEALKFLEKMWGEWGDGYALRCLVELADAGNTRAGDALDAMRWEDAEVNDIDDVIQYLRKAADSGSGWGKHMLYRYADWACDEDINFLFEVGGTIALTLAARHGSTGVVEHFLDEGVDVNAKDQEQDGKTALMLAVGSWNPEEMVELLLEAGADVQAKDEDGKTALDLADNEEIRALLRAAGAEE